MKALARFEVTEMVDGRPATRVAYFPVEVQPALAEMVRPIVDQAVARAAATLTLTRADAALLMAGELARQAADAEAYEREAGRRGVLAL